MQLSAEEGILEATESEMIQEILKLGDKTARDCMTPRVDLFAIPDDLTNEEAMERLRAGRHRRVPGVWRDAGRHRRNARSHALFPEPGRSITPSS